MVGGPHRRPPFHRYLGSRSRFSWVLGDEWAGCIVRERAGGPSTRRATVKVPSDVTAVVLTFRRPRLAGEVVRSLLAKEGFAANRVIVVVNADGGLDDSGLESEVCMVRLPANLGPAGGFRAGLEAAFEDPSTQWAYLCEDDIGLFDLPSPRWPRSSNGYAPLTSGRTERRGQSWPTAVVSSIGGIRTTSSLGPAIRRFSKSTSRRGGLLLWRAAWSSGGSCRPPSGSSVTKTLTSFAGSRSRSGRHRRLRVCDCGRFVQTLQGRDEVNFGERPGDAEEPLAARATWPEISFTWPGRTGRCAGCCGTSRYLGAAHAAGIEQRRKKGDAPRPLRRVARAHGSAPSLLQDDGRASTGRRLSAERRLLRPGLTCAGSRSRVG